MPRIVYVPRFSALRTLFALFVLFTTTTITSLAQSLTTLATFDVTNGSYPVSALVQGTDGDFYGTTAAGGNTNTECFIGTCGTVFKISPSGVLTTLYRFCSQLNCADGSEPLAGLLLSTDGSFYGATAEGGTGSGSSCGFLNGCGTIFKLTPTGVFKTIYNFGSKRGYADGDHPTATLLEASNGNLYGSTFFGGDATSNCCGTIFKIDRTGILTTVYAFNSSGSDGGGPNGLIQATDGAFYGTTYNGGIANGGTVFKMTPAGVVTTLHDFCSQPNCTDGMGSNAPLLQTIEGTLIGTTLFGGSTNEGTIFRLLRSGKFGLYSFSGADGLYPEAVIQATDGNVYGTTDYGGTGNCAPSTGCGTIFEVAPQSGGITTLYSFGPSDFYAVGGLLQGTDGIFYGTTAGSDDSTFGYGTVFSFSTGLGPFVSFVRNSGKVSQTGNILGKGFTGTTAVTLNGTPASFTVVSDTFLKATVPAGATTGYVTVATPTGTLTSNVPFQVIP